MKKKWTNNIGIKILSVAIAFLLWVVIINIEDPTTSRTFHVKVDIQNDDIVQSSGKVYKITEGEYADVTIKGNKSFVDSLTEKDITATADFRYLSIYGSVQITAQCTKYTNTRYIVDLGSIDHVLVELENKEQNKFIVRFNIVGEPPAGYYVDTDLITSNPTKITVTGGESIIKSISSVEVNIDASSHTSNFTTKLQPKVYDNSGNLIDPRNITCSVTQVTVDVKVLETKKIPVKINTTGTVAPGYKAENPIYDPTEIVIAGTKENLNAINSVELNVSVQNEFKSVKKVVDLTKGILPEGIYLVADKINDKTNVNIEIPIEQFESKEITFGIRDIAVKMPVGSSTSKFEDDSQQFKVKVFAVAAEINDITIDTLKPTIDLTNNSYGTYNVAIQFSDSYLVEPIGNIKVKVTLSDPTGNDHNHGNSDTQEPTVKPTQQPTSKPSNGGMATDVPSQSP